MRLEHRARAAPGLSDCQRRCADPDHRAQWRRQERIAEIIHANSRVKDGPFIAVNCGALPSDLLEAELFGAEAGAYTGAGKAREGVSRRPMAAPCFSTRSAICHQPDR